MSLRKEFINASVGTSIDVCLFQLFKVIGCSFTCVALLKDFEAFDVLDDFDEFLVSDSSREIFNISFSELELLDSV